MKSDPTDASAPFNLGNMLRAGGRNVEAEAALRAATRVDPTFADAWYNLSDLLDEQGRIHAAIECLRTALRVAPDYVDAIFNLALLLQRTNQYAEAADYWRRYLTRDRQSDWATRARRSLKFCEMQVHLIASAYGYWPHHQPTTVPPNIVVMSLSANAQEATVICSALNLFSVYQFSQC